MTSTARGGSSASSEHVAWLVDQMRSRGVRAGEAAQEVLACAKREGGTDNATCLILYLGARLASTIGDGDGGDP